MSSREQGRNRSKVRTENHDPPASALQRLQTRGERLLHWFPELGKTLRRDGEPGLEALMSQLQSLRGQVSKRAQETGRDLEARAERILAELEKQAVRGLGPILTRANVASRPEVETLERRLAHLEGRLGPLLDDRTHLSTRVAAIERQLEEARADASERIRELSLQLSSADEVRAELNQLRGHLDALSKDQVTRSLELGKQHDRLVRLEMRFGDYLKDHGAQAAHYEQSQKRLVAVDRALEETTRLAHAAAEEAATSARAVRETADRLESVRGENTHKQGEIDRAVQRLSDLDRSLHQLDLRLGDLGERHSAIREELAGLGARISQLELMAAQRTATASRTDHAEGH